MSTLTLDSFLARYAEAASTRLPVAQTIRGIAAAGRQIWSIVQDGASDAFATVQTGTNSDGDQQTALDIVTDRIFLDAAQAAPVAAYASEELDLAQALDPEQPLALAIDPLDGSSNVNLNLSFGTIFSILPSFQPQNGPLASFLRPGSQPARRRPHGLRAAAVAGAERRRGHAHLRIQRPDRRLPPRRRERARSADGEGVRHQRLQLPPLGRFGAALFRRLREGRARAARARLQHALARLAGRRGLPHPRARRRVPLSGRQAPGLRQRPAAPRLRGQSRSRS